MKNLFKKSNNEINNATEEESLESEESLLKSKLEKLRNPNVKSFISLKNINKVYPNGFHAVYDFNIEISKNEFIVFVGPSGCGKSTTLRMIAGLEDITAGDLYIDQIYSNNLTPKERDIAMVFQSYALYPHMSVYDNMAFGLKMRHVDKDEIDKRVKNAAEILDLTQLLDRKPRQLSGGQMQRVALGRTIVRNAKLFLMDEPLSNLDAKLRVTMRSEIVKLHQRLNATTIYVTHDQTEAMTMASRIVVMNKGHVQQIGTPEEIYSNPANKFVATFIGTPSMNMLNAHYNNGVVTFNDGYSFELSKERQSDIKKFFENEIANLKDRINNINYEVELLPHKVDKEKLKTLDSSQQIDNTSEFTTDAQSEIKAHNEVAKAVLKGSNQFSFKNLFKKNDLPSFDEVKEKLLKELNDLIVKYESCLTEGFDCTFGIRPEHIELAENKNLFKEASPVFKLNVQISELLGNEYYIHGDLNDTEFIARIDNDRKIAQNANLELVFNVEKIHLFDNFSNKTIF